MFSNVKINKLGTVLFETCSLSKSRPTNLKTFGKTVEVEKMAFFFFLNFSALRLISRFRKSPPTFFSSHSITDTTF